MLLGEELFLEEIGIILKLEEIPEELKSRQDDKCFIYCLCEPTTNEIRYIGITNNLGSRFRSHYSAKENNWRSNWINSLKNNKIKPKMLLLTTINNVFENDDEFYVYVDNIETKIIKHFGKNGYRLTNHDKLITDKYNYSQIGEHRNTKKVYQFDNNYNFVREWNSLKEIVINFSVCYSHVSIAIKRETRVKDYYFSFNKTFKKTLKSIGKICYIYDINGNFICEYESVAEAARQLNVNRTDLSDCLNGRQQSCCNYMISYSKVEKMFYEPKRHKKYKVQQFTKDGVLIKTFNSLTESAKSMGLSKTTISKCALGVNKTSGGFVWKYVL